MTLTTRFNQRSSAKLRRADETGIYCVFGSMISWSNSRLGASISQGRLRLEGATHSARRWREFSILIMTEARVYSKKNKSYSLDSLCSCGTRDFGRR